MNACNNTKSQQGWKRTVHCCWVFLVSFYIFFGFLFLINYHSSAYITDEDENNVQNDVDLFKEDIDHLRDRHQNLAYQKNVRVPPDSKINISDNEEVFVNSLSQGVCDTKFSSEVSDLAEIVHEKKLPNAISNENHEIQKPLQEFFPNAEQIQKIEDVRPKNIGIHENDCEFTQYIPVHANIPDETILDGTNSEKRLTNEYLSEYSFEKEPLEETWGEAVETVHYENSMKNSHFEGHYKNYATSFTQVTENSESEMDEKLSSMKYPYLYGIDVNHDSDGTFFAEYEKENDTQTEFGAPSHTILAEPRISINSPISNSDRFW